MKSPAQYIRVHSVATGSKNRYGYFSFSATELRRQSIQIKLRGRNNIESKYINKQTGKREINEQEKNIKPRVWKQKLESNV